MHANTFTPYRFIRRNSVESRSSCFIQRSVINPKFRSTFCFSSWILIQNLSSISLYIISFYVYDISHTIAVDQFICDDDGSFITSAQVDSSPAHAYILSDYIIIYLDIIISYNSFESRDRYLLIVHDLQKKRFTSVQRKK